MNQTPKPIVFSKKEAKNISKEKSGNITFPILSAIVIVVFVSSCLITIGARFLWHTYQTLPEPQELANIQPSLVTRVYAADSSLIHEFSIERRFWVPLDSIPDILQNAVISIEDRRFHEHWGVDLKRIMGAAWGNLVQGGYGQGASTITQQLARNIYFTQEKTIMRKVREILTAIQLEQYYTKDEILELYLNMVYLGAGAYGVEAASQRYFSKNIWDITLNEAAILAGIIQLPEYYRPDREKNIDRITVRRRSVLRGMLRNGFITEEEYRLTNAESIAADPYKRLDTKAPYFVETVRQKLEATYGADMLYNGGLHIYTTLNEAAQDSTEKALQKHLDTLQRFPNRIFVDSSKAWRLINVSRKKMMENFDSLYAANDSLFQTLPDSQKLRKIEASVVAMDVQSGAVRILIGGRDYKKSKYNRAIQAVRQPGSAFKPFVYAASLTCGYTPATVVVDKPITIYDPARGESWRPENFSRTFSGPLTIREALRRSINLIAIQIVQDIGTAPVIKIARDMGLTHRLPSVPALAIGAGEATNLELTRAYCAFGNLGQMPEPYFVERIVDHKGRVLFEHEDVSKRVIEPEIASLMTHLMEDVVLRGTATSIRRSGFTRPSAGKTGTTNNYSDAWYIGYTPQISCGVWIGADQQRSLGGGITGTRGAVPLWTSAMKALHEDLPRESFIRAGGTTSFEVCNKSRQIANRYCPAPYKEWFLGNTLPEKCSMHTLQEQRDSSNVLDFFGTSSDNKPAAEENSGQLMF